MDLANVLFDEWGWAFKSAGAGFPLAALWTQRRRARACPVAVRPSLAKSAVWIAVAAVATYLAFYGLTTWLGGLAT